MVVVVAVMIAAVTVVIVRQGGGSGQHQGGQRHQRRKQHHLLHLLFPLFRGFVPNSVSTDPASPAGASSRTCEPSRGSLSGLPFPLFGWGEPTVRAHGSSCHAEHAQDARALPAGVHKGLRSDYPPGGINRAAPGAQAGPKWASAARKKSKRAVLLAAAGSGPRPKHPVGVGLRHPRKPPARCPARRRRGYPPTAAATVEVADPVDLGRYPPRRLAPPRRRAANGRPSSRGSPWHPPRFRRRSCGFA